MEAVSLLDEINARAGMDLARQLDESLREGVAARIGADVNLLELAPGRLTAVSYSSDRERTLTYCFDGEPILRVWPIEVKMDGYIVTVHRKAQRFEPRLAHAAPAL
jgi:uncharacterized cupin superfamily protein